MLDLLRSLVRGPWTAGPPPAPDDWRCGDGRPPLSVVEPGTPAEVCAIMAFCSEHHLVVQPAGNGTWLSRGPLPEQDYIVLTTRRLTTVIEYEPEDLTGGFQAGVTLTALRELAGANRQIAALDPPALPDATVGPTFALSAAGPLRCAYGTPRDQALGLEVVTGDGRLLHVGGRVVKNVAGYDLTRLITGSHGALGIITQVNLRLRPAPLHDVTFRLRAATPDPLLDRAGELGAAPFQPAALELIGPGAHAPDWWLLVRVHGNEQTMQAAVAELAGATLPAERFSDESAPALWQDLSRAEARAVFCARLGALPSQLPQLLRQATELATTLTDARIAAHAADGIVRVFTDAPVTADAAARLNTMRVELAANGGSLLLPALPPALHGAIEPYGPYGNELRLMRELKRVFDPAGILAPGRLFA